MQYDSVHKTKLIYIEIRASIMQSASFQKVQCFAWVLKDTRHLLQIMQK